jgi:TatD DNase family protein
MKNSRSMVDIGVNLSNKQFRDDVEGVLSRAKQASVDKLVLTGTSLEASTAVIELCDKFNATFPDMLYATVGVHPHDADKLDANSLPQMRALTNQSKVVAIGETGLDFHRNLSPPSAQIRAFEDQLALAAELKMPLFMHERDAARRQLEILRAYRDHFTQGVIHCFTGDRKTLFNYLDLDLHIGITGWICDERRGLELQKLVANIPLNRLMVETDAPYLMPRTIEPPPTTRCNEPCHLPWVVKMISNLRDEPVDSVAEATSKTAQVFFNL